METAMIVFWGAAFVAYVVLPVLARLIKINVKVSEPAQPETSVVHLYSGPSDGEVHEVYASGEELPPFFVQPYVPTGEDGFPTPENIVSGHNGMAFVKPNLAYYQQVTDSDYIYVRDINEMELNKIRVTGELPKFQTHDE